MIIKVKKLLFYGIKEDLDIFFSTAQENGFIQFIGPNKKTKILSDVVKDYLQSIKILKKQPSIEQVKVENNTDIIVKKTLHLNQSLEKLFDEKREVESEIVRISPFGDFSLIDIKSLEEEVHMFFQFYAVKKTKKKIAVSDEFIFIKTEHDLDYYLSISREKKNYPKIIEVNIDRTLSFLNERKEVLEKQILRTEKSLKELAIYLNEIKKHLLKKLNVFNLENTKKESSYPIVNSLFSIEAWVPINKLEKLNNFIKRFSVDYSEIEIEEKDRKPTYMQNKGFAKIGEDLVEIYDTPSVHDKDPSIWVLVFFSIFFAMIISDAGYGLVYLAAYFFFKYVIKPAGPMIKRVVNLTLILSITTIIWGVFTGSFFGVGVDPKDKLDKFIFLNYLIEKKSNYHLEKKDDVYKEIIKKFPKTESIKDPKELLASSYQIENNKKVYTMVNDFKNNILMEIALLTGVVHISLSFARYLFRNFSNLGWILVVIGGYLYCPSILNATSIIQFLNIIPKETAVFAGKVLLIFGISFAIIVAIIFKRLQGIFELMNIIQIFADILSYLRLYALGLAGMIMATTFNNLGLKMNLFLGIFVIIIGHVINFLLNIMSGVIHGLRLNFIEWYHYSFEGDGKLFDPLKLLK